jgi:LysR family glycine cleavage system transcriptional activator
MVRRYYDLPSLTTLAVFEATARRQSFKLAAAELNVTTGAISRQIKAIEDDIGSPLFTRSSTGVELTAAGVDLYAVLSQSFGRISEIAQRIKRGSRALRVTLACTNAMAMMWLIPRMGSFWRANPEIVVDHLISDLSRDYRRADVELRIRYGFGAWPDETAQLLLPETIYPVCSPRFAEMHAGATANDIPNLPLLHVDWVDRDWTDWDEFLRRAGIAHGPLLGGRFNNFAVTLQATQDDQGIAVGWHRLVQPLIQSGKLVKFTDLHMPAPGSYCLTWNDKRELSEAAKRLRIWLINEAARDLEA